MDTQEQNQNTEQKTDRKLQISTPAAIITAGVLIAFALIFSGKGASIKQKDSGVNKAEVKVSVRGTDYVRGDITKADIVVIEYSDSDCPFCQKFHNTMKEILRTYGTKVAWVYRHLPLSIHANAQNEAVALECVGSLGGNEKFWQFLDEIIDITATPEKNKSVMTSIATSIGIDKELFDVCLKNPEITKKVEEQIIEAQNIGAKGTPYSIVINRNGEQVVVPGAYPIEELSKIIDGLMK